MARLVLLKKPGKPDLAPSSYRPICLLSEAGKLFEKIICNRLVRFLDASGGIAETQFDFRSNRSTVDSIWRIRSIVDDAMRDGGMVLAVIRHSQFNSLPWPVIRSALADKEVPACPGRILVGQMIFVCR